MSRGTKISLLLAGGLALIGAIVYFVFVPFFRGSSGPNANAPISGGQGSSTDAPAEPERKLPPVPKELPDEAKAQAAARVIAQTFAVRLATYTNQNGLSNLSDLKMISTPAVWKYIDGQYRRDLLKSLPPAEEYYAATATAANIAMAAAGDAEMSAVVPLLKVETGAVSKTTYPVLNLKLVLSDGAWLVSWLEWKK